MSFPKPPPQRAYVWPAILSVVLGASFAAGEPPQKPQPPDQADRAKSQGTPSSRSAATDAPGQADEDFDDGTFAFSPPVICSQINGYEDYEERPDANLTKDEKLQLYFRPRHFKSEKVGKKYQAWFSADVRIRRKGQKILIYTKDKFADYKHADNEPLQLLFLRSSISLKSLKPGDYELDLILHDLVGKSAPAKRTVFFKIVPTTFKGEEVEEPGRSQERPGP